MNKTLAVLDGLTLAGWGAFWMVTGPSASDPRPQSAEVLHDVVSEGGIVEGLSSAETLREHRRRSQAGDAVPLAFLQCLHWYAKEEATQWQREVLAIADHIGDLEAFRFFTYVLEVLPIDRGPVLVPFVHHMQVGFRRQALHALGKLKDRQPHLQSFVSGLGDADSTVVHAALHALKGLADRSLLPHYRSIAERYPMERDYVLANLDHRLKELGMTRQALLQASVDGLEGKTASAGVWRRVGSLLGRAKSRFS